MLGGLFFCSNIPKPWPVLLIFKCFCNTILEEYYDTFQVEVVALRKKTVNKKLELLPAITTVYLVLMLTVFLFWFGPDGYQTISFVKHRLFLILCGGYILVMLVAALESVAVGALKFRSPLAILRASNWTQRLILGYIVLTWLSALFSDYFPQTILGASRNEGALTITIYGICFLLVSVYGRTSKWLLYVLGCSVTVFSVLCLVQIAGFNPLGLYPPGYGYADAGIAYSGAYLGTIGNVDLVSAFLSLVIPIMWVALLRLYGRTKFLLLIPLILALVALVQMNVLAGLVGIFAGGVVMLPVVVPAGERTRLSLAIGCAILIAAFGVTVFVADIGSGLFHELHEFLHGRAEDSFGSGRIHIWKQVLQAIPEHFWLGTGPDTMCFANFEGFSRYDETLNLLLTAEIDIAHNEYLNILYHQGIFAFLAYVSALALLVKKWLIDSAVDQTTAILGSATGCYCIQAFFGLSMSLTAPFFWLTIALFAGERKNKL